MHVLKVDLIEGAVAASGVIARIGEPVLGFSAGTQEALGGDLREGGRDT